MIDGIKGDTFIVTENVSQFYTKTRCLKYFCIIILYSLELPTENTKFKYIIPDLFEKLFKSLKSCEELKISIFLFAKQK